MAETATQQYSERDLTLEEAVASGFAVPNPAPTWQPTWFEVGTVKFAAFGDRLLISEDEFRSGYECRTCNGSGRVACTECEGAGVSKFNAAIVCKWCYGGK